MSKPTRKSRKTSIKKEDEFLKPIDITKFGTSDDPCFGKLYELSAEECKRCGDSPLCAVVFSQNLTVERKSIESKSRFKDLEKNPGKGINASLSKWVKQKKDEGYKRSEIIKMAKKSFGSNRDEIKELYKAN